MSVLDSSGVGGDGTKDTADSVCIPCTDPGESKEEASVWDSTPANANSDRIMGRSTHRDRDRDRGRCDSIPWVVCTAGWLPG